MTTVYLLAWAMIAVGAIGMLACIVAAVRMLAQAYDDMRNGQK